MPFLYLMANRLFFQSKMWLETLLPFLAVSCRDWGCSPLMNCALKMVIFPASPCTAVGDFRMFDYIIAYRGTYFRLAGALHLI